MVVVEVNGYTIEPGANLEGADFEGEDFHDIELQDPGSYVSYTTPDLQGANLRNTNFQEASLSGGLLHRVDLQGANLDRADHSVVRGNGFSSSESTGKAFLQWTPTTRNRSP